MKNKLSTTTRRAFVTKSTLVAAAVLMAVGTSYGMTQTPVYADRYQDQIDALEAEINSYQQEASDLSRQADTYENAVRNFKNQIASIQKRIDLNEAKHVKLEKDIKVTEENIQKNQDVLGSTIADLYIDSSMTPIEMLASSSTIGDYVDKQEYRTAVREQVEVAIGNIKTLREELDGQKKEVESVLADQNTQKSNLAAKQAEQRKLARETRGQESRYRAMTEKSRAEREKVIAEQQAALEAARASWGGDFISVGGGGSYPWGGAPYPCWSGGCVDPWGLYYRECVSYVAWKLDSEGYRVQHFNGAGDAAQWPSTTASYTSASSQPAVGNAAVDPYSAPPWGHVMYVEAVNSDGSIRISEYNFAGPGQYSERDVSPGQYSGWTFLTFPR